MYMTINNKWLFPGQERLCIASEKADYLLNVDFLFSQLCSCILTSPFYIPLSVNEVSFIKSAVRYLYSSILVCFHHNLWSCFQSIKCWHLISKCNLYRTLENGKRVQWWGKNIMNEKSMTFSAAFSIFKYIWKYPTKHTQCFNFLNRDKKRSRCYFCR